MNTGNEKDMATQHSARAATSAQQVKVLPSVITGCLIIVGLVLLNAFPGLLGVVRSANEPQSYVLRLSPAFFREILPRLNVLWVLSLGVIAVNLYRGHWSWGTRLLDYALTIFGVILLTRLIGGGEQYLVVQWQSLGMLVIQVAGRSVPLVIVGVKAALAGALAGAMVSLGLKARPLVSSAIRERS